MYVASIEVKAALALACKCNEELCEYLSSGFSFTGSCDTEEKRRANTSSAAVIVGQLNELISRSEEAEDYLQRLSREDMLLQGYVR